jgi:hypothetical protein
MSLASPSETTDETRCPATDEESAARSRLPRGDGDDPPHDEDQTKSGGYRVVSQETRPRGDGDDPPHDEDQTKTGYRVASE